MTGIVSVDEVEPCSFDPCASIPIDKLKVTSFKFSYMGGEEKRAQYEQFVRGLTLELDNEPGDDPEHGTWLWVKENNADRDFLSPFQTFIFSEPENDQIIATASFVADDRGVASRLGLDKTPEYFGIWGFFLVRRDLRAQGIGAKISKYVDEHVQLRVDAGGRPRDVYLFTKEPHAMRIYERLGFVRQDQIVNLEGFGFDEFLYKKRYEPQTVSTEALTEAAAEIAAEPRSQAEAPGLTEDSATPQAPQVTVDTAIYHSLVGRAFVLALLCTGLASLFGAVAFGMLLTGHWFSGICMLAPTAYFACGVRWAFKPLNKISATGVRIVIGD